MLLELRDLFAYNRWATERILTACEGLSPDELTRELGGSFPSVWKTLAHLYAAENTWLARWNGAPAGAPSDIGDIREVAELRDKWRALWERQSQRIAEATDADVRRAIPVRLLSDGSESEQQLGATMRHCMNHATYHRGQITNFFRMLGKKPVGTDLGTYYRECPPNCD